MKINNGIFYMDKLVTSIAPDQSNCTVTLTEYNGTKVVVHHSSIARAMETIQHEYMGDKRNKRPFNEWIADLIADSLNIEFKYGA